MRAALPFPNISPEIFAFSIGTFEFALRWYALGYIVGILIAWWMGARMLRTARLWPNQVAPMTPPHLEAFVTWAIVGIVLGGRLGFVLFYNLDYYLANPAQILVIWQGGMAFHGGFLGVVVAAVLFGRINNIPLLSLGDLLAAIAAPGLFLVRVANFVNAELWGRPTDLPWGVIFPGAEAQNCPGIVGVCARHPSQLYEAALEGLVLGLLLLWLVYRRGWFLRPGAAMGTFIAGYGIARFFVELVRQPDIQFTGPGNPIGYAVQFGDWGLTQGQLLSLPMICVGLALLIWAKARP